MKQVRVIDSHTEGEPTRLIIEGGPDLGSGTMEERRGIFHRDFDWLRSAVVNEPRGSEAVVGGILCEPVSSSAAAGIIFFNNVSFLGMCGHGTIGLVASLAYLGKISAGTHKIETPVGDVSAMLGENGQVSITNVTSYRYQTGVKVAVEGYGEVAGDIAWGGNWFFLIGDSPVPVTSSKLEALASYAKAVKQALVTQGITGADGAEIDHIEIFGAPERIGADSKNYVLCPGGAYDRSPCGTGLSAKLACLAADCKLAEGQEWHQESIIGTEFIGRYENVPGGIRPTITARAFVTADSKLLFDDNDPLRHGIQL